MTGVNFVGELHLVYFSIEIAYRTWVTHAARLGTVLFGAFGDFPLSNMPSSSPDLDKRGRLKAM